MFIHHKMAASYIARLDAANFLPLRGTTQYVSYLGTNEADKASWTWYHSLGTNISRLPLARSLLCFLFLTFLSLDRTCNTFSNLQTWHRSWSKPGLVGSVWRTAASQKNRWYRSKFYRNKIFENLFSYFETVSQKWRSDIRSSKFYSSHCYQRFSSNGDRSRILGLGHKNNGITKFQLYLNFWKANKFPENKKM